jgi:hypothetical protein
MPLPHKSGQKVFRFYSTALFIFGCLQKQEKRRDSTSSSRLKKIWRSPKQSSSATDSGGENSSSRRESKNSLQLPQSIVGNSNQKQPTCSLPLLQIWPSQDDSPRGEADGQSFVFSIISDDNVSHFRSHNPSI